MENKFNHILQFIELHIREKGYATTLREISADAGYAGESGCRYNLYLMERCNYITRQLRTARSIRITDKGREYLREVGE